MDAETKQHLAEWLEFFRDLGFDDLYRRQADNVVEPVPAAPLAAATKPTVTAARTAAIAPDSRRAPIEPQTARPLSLFEAAPKSRETLEEIRADLGDCMRCKLSAGRHHIVFGAGSPSAELVLIGEGPGADEDEQGLPFVGRAGQLLNKILQLTGIRREDIYICNIVKCRPPGNRAPEADEIAACSPFLFRQLDSIHPRLVCCLGAPAARTVLGIKEGITKVHGRFVDFRDGKAMATVHPAYVLRNPREESILRADFASIKAFLEGTAH